MCGDECGWRDIGNMEGSKRSEMIGFDLRLKAHKTMKTVTQKLLGQPAHGAYTDIKFRIVKTALQSLLSVLSTLEN